MKYQYVVVKYYNTWDLEDSHTKIICIATSEEEAKQIVVWLRHNDSRFDDSVQAYGYSKCKVFDNIVSFVGDYLNDNKKED